MQNLRINEEFWNFEDWTRMTKAMKQEYQAESEYLNVKLICKEEKYVLVHEFAIFQIDFFRLAIRNFKRTNLNISCKITIDLKCYTFETVKLFMNMVYQVNTMSLTTQNFIDLLLFTYDCDHYDEELFQWHFQAINLLCEELLRQIPKMSTTEKAAVVANLYHMKILPITKLQEALFPKEISGSMFQNSAENSSLRFFLGNNSGSSIFSNKNAMSPFKSNTGTESKFVPIMGQDDLVETRLLCYTAMRYFTAKSLEELRMDDYVASRKSRSSTQPQKSRRTIVKAVKSKEQKSSTVVKGVTP